MDRIEKSKAKVKELFGETKFSVAETDPDLLEIANRFIFGEVFFEGDLDDKTRVLITIAVLTANQTLPQIRAYVKAALNIGLSAAEIKEAVYHCAPYAGFPKAINALSEVNEVLRSEGIALPLESQTETGEDDRFDTGLALHVSIFGESINKAREKAPEGQKHIRDYLSALCFGDFYTRTVLDVKTRELLTFCVLCSLGGCENQVKAHVKGNVNLGNGKGTLVSAITHCLPLIGFPRTLNALACVNEVLPKD